MKKDTNTIGNTKKISENWKLAVYTHTHTLQLWGTHSAASTRADDSFGVPFSSASSHNTSRLCPETQRWNDIYSLRTLVRRWRAKLQSQSRNFALMDSRHKGSKLFLGFFFCGMSNTFATNTFLLSLVAEDEVRKKHQDVKLSWQQTRRGRGGGGFS